MNSPRLFNGDELKIIAQHIPDSMTFCRFSQINKKCNNICKSLLLKKTKIIKWRCGWVNNLQFSWSEMPNGNKHGLLYCYYDSDSDQLKYKEHYRDGISIENIYDFHV